MFSSHLLYEIKRELQIMNVTLQKILEGQDIEASSLNDLGAQVAELVKADVALKVQLANTDPQDAAGAQQILDKQLANNNTLTALLKSLPVAVPVTPGPGPTPTPVPVPVTVPVPATTNTLTSAEKFAAMKSTDGTTV